VHQSNKALHLIRGAETDSMDSEDFADLEAELFKLDLEEHKKPIAGPSGVMLNSVVGTNGGFGPGTNDGSHRRPVKNRESSKLSLTLDVSSNA
jgi:hypothetical protein